MRQVPHDAGSPVHHLLIGNGRLSRHLAHYFTLEGISFVTWKSPRELTQQFYDLLESKTKPVTHVWILVSDSAINTILESVLGRAGDAHLLHASGACVISGARSVHPLMTFGSELYPLESYRRISFTVEPNFDGVAPSEILGGLPNPVVFLENEKRVKYHALVSAAGNFPALLWSEIFERFESDLSLPREILAPYLFQTLTNVIRSGSEAVTGPLVRGDHATIGAHERVLKGTPLGKLYSAFIDFFYSSSQGEKQGAPNVRSEKQH